MFNDAHKKFLEEQYHLDIDKDDLLPNAGPRSGRRSAMGVDASKADYSVPDLEEMKRIVNA